MITEILHLALLVRDYDEAKHFYCGKLGFTVEEDTEQASGKRWVRLRPPGGGRGSELLLSKAVGDDQERLVGNQAGGRVLLFLRTDDFDADFEDLREKGVEFSEGPVSQPYGKVAIFRDLYGNRIDLIGPWPN